MPATPTLGGTLVVKINSVTYACDPSPSQEAYDRKYAEIEEANGTRNNIIDMIEGDSDNKWTIHKILEDTDGPLLTLCGLGATVGLPTANIPVVYYTPLYTRTILNATVNDVEFTFEHGKGVQLVISGMATSPPVDTVAVAAPAVTNGNLLRFADILTFFTKAVATPAPVRKFSVKLDQQLYAYYGLRTDGLTLPTNLVPTVPKVTGGFEKLLVDDLDYALYLAACQAKADVGITAASFCGTTPKTLTLTPKNCLYMKPSRSGGVKEGIVEQFTYQAINVGGANPLVYSLI